MRSGLLITVVTLSLASDAFAQEDLSLNITVHIQDLGDRKGTDGEWLGTKGQSKRLELINIKKLSGPDNVQILYRCHIQDFGETEWLQEGEDCGTRGHKKRLEAFAVRLTGAGAKNYRLSYQCHLQDQGDTGFFASPQYCGSTAQGRRLEALLIKIEPAE
jgi:uncharacterized protein YjdB